MKKRRSPQQNHNDLIENLIGLGDFSARKSYYPELLRKIDELEAEKDRYKWLFENALHGIFQARADGPVQAANPAIARICGYATEQQFCTAIADLSRDLFVTEEDYYRLLRLLVRDGKRVGFETQIRHKDGHAIEVSMNVLLKDEERGLIEAFVQDITERKHAQNALAQLNAELEDRVLQRTEELSKVNNQMSLVNRQLRQEIDERRHVEIELDRARQEAVQANLSKDKYLAAASHDLLQPLNAARLLVAILQEQQKETSENRLVERIHTALNGAEELLSDLLDISKLDGNAVTPEPSDFAIGTLLQSLHSEFDPLARKAGLMLRLQSSSLVVNSDPRLLARILRNFISNAIRYTPGGGVLIGCRRLTNNRISVQVWDTGAGIPESKREQIFAEFQQLDNRIAGRDKGVGLGLAIVDRMARILDHPLRLQSTPGQGSCFSIELPISTVPAQRPPAETLLVAQADNLQNRGVLVIDNEESILNSMGDLLQLWGCHVDLAHDLDSAWDCMQRSGPPDLILADYHLDNNQDGVELIATLRQSLGKAIPAIIITADRSDEVRSHLQTQQLPHLNKPLKPGKLRALMAHCLNP